MCLNSVAWSRRNDWAIGNVEAKMLTLKVGKYEKHHAYPTPPLVSSRFRLGTQGGGYSPAAAGLLVLHAHRGAGGYDLLPHGTCDRDDT